MPLAGVITQQVRPGHQAIDISCVIGTPVHAAHDGEGRTRWSRETGWTFTLDGRDGLQTLYGHLASGAPAGTYSRGDVIGACGDTGLLSTGPHLHFGSNRPERLAVLDAPLTHESPATRSQAPWLVLVPAP